MNSRETTDLTYDLITKHGQKLNQIIRSVVKALDECNSRGAASGGVLASGTNS